MFFLFGFGGYATHLGSALLPCPHCGETGVQDLYETGQKLSVFFIPVARFGRRYVLTCQRCGESRAVDANTAQRIRRGEQLPARNPFDLR